MKFIILIICLLFGKMEFVQADNLPNMPFDRFVEKQQKENNVDTSLFQNDKIGDLREQRQRNEKEERGQLFRKKSQRYQPEKQLFKKTTNHVNDVKKVTHKKESHYGRLILLLIVCGAVGSIIIWWKGRCNGKGN